VANGEWRKLHSPFFYLKTIVMARLVRAIHFPEALTILRRFWKIDGVRTLSLQTKGGHDD
jgi:hypothetical protein